MGKSEMGSRAFNTAQLLRKLFEATASSTGEEFFRSFVRHLAVALEVRFTFVSEEVEPAVTARTLAFWGDDRFLDNMEYELPGTPCELVLRGEMVQISEKLYVRYPSEQMFGVPIESYLGIPLMGRQGEILGHVTAMDIEPMIEKAHDFSAFEVFALRATAELERLQAEQALRQAQAWLVQSEKMAALGQLTAGVTHEINTPIGVIGANADMIRRSVERVSQILSPSSPDIRNGELAKCLEALENGAKATEEASRRIVAVVGDLKKFAALDTASSQEMDIHEGLDSTLSLLRVYLKDGVTVVKDYGDIPTIFGSPSDLNQVFFTILKNACDAIDEEGIITITTWSTEANLYATISDTGRGIPDKQLATLFDVGFTRKGSRVGMRLGLATASAIVRKHSGEIGVKSAPGEGTQFTIQLRLNGARVTAPA